MKIELKNVQYYPRLSQETNAFTANLYINVVHAGLASNEGHGGPTSYQAKDETGRGLIGSRGILQNIIPSHFLYGGKEHSYDQLGIIYR